MAMDCHHRFESKQLEDESLIAEENKDDSHSSSSSSENDHERFNAQPSVFKSSDWRKDQWNIGLLLFLYLLQGVPLGMAASIPLIIQTYGVTWSEQATFSFAFWPFSLKLLWAPVVDALYLKRFGRRKTWLIPVQYTIGLVMILLSCHIHDILTEPSPSSTDYHPRML